MHQTPLAAAHPPATRLFRTMRRDAWWVAPLGMAILLLSFVVYSTYAAFQGGYYWVNGTNYISPFYSPELWGTSPHAILGVQPSWWPTSLLPFSVALLILAVPGGFRLTCYYYRKAYYRSIWLDPVACAVGEPRSTYWGENSFPLIMWNAHRYFLYLSLIFVLILTYDGISACFFPVQADGAPFLYPVDAHGVALPGAHPDHYVFGLGLGSLILLLNPLLIAGYTFGCHSLRHLVGGRKDCFGASACGVAQHRLWRAVSALNRNHRIWAMTSLVVVAFADIYVRLVAHHVWTDIRFF